MTSLSSRFIRQNNGEPLRPLNDIHCVDSSDLALSGMDLNPTKGKTKLQKISAKLCNSNTGVFQVYYIQKYLIQVQYYFGIQWEMYVSLALAFIICKNCIPFASVWVHHGFLYGLCCLSFSFLCCVKCLFCGLRSVSCFQFYVSMDCPYLIALWFKRRLYIMEDLHR